MPDPGTLLAALSALAHTAGIEVMKIYAEPVSAALKADLSPVTEADLAAERIILEGLARIAPQIPVISEEAASQGRIPQAAQQFFLVDPLDGTREFISRNGEFTINIALIENAKPVAGVVYAPAINRIFRGSLGLKAEQATLSADSPEASAKWQPIRALPVPPKGLRVVASRSHRDAETDAFLAARDVTDLVAAGSSLKFCLIAAGEADLYPRFGRTMEWDTAAGDAILRAVGGQVVTLDGAPLTYRKTTDGFANPSFIAVRSGVVLP